jgi:2-keto-4-pentenoate hydratase/2-oxohepta-3-ene-1,7-dioic acid hydratase in catechol pathway
MKKHEMRRLMFMLLLTGERRNAKNQKKMIMTMAMIVEYWGNLRTHTKTDSAWS